MEDTHLETEVRGTISTVYPWEVVASTGMLYDGLVRLLRNMGPSRREWEATLVESLTPNQRYRLELKLVPLEAR